MPAPLPSHGASSLIHDAKSAIHAISICTGCRGLLRQAKRIVCLTGAGVSAESGVATFRDAQTGFWSHFDPQQLASQAGGLRRRSWAGVALVYAPAGGLVEQAQPNPGHLALAA